MKRCVAGILVVIMLLSNFCVATPLPKKKETVYVNLDSYGQVSKINIFSKWVTNGAVELKDKTNYLTVSNLTNKEKYLKSGDELVWNVSGEKIFSYTGEVSGDYYDLIPWNFNISYKLNGVDITSDELFGAHGLVEITIDITANEKANEYYKNNYILEITGTYDMNKYLSVESEDAMITDTGNSKTVMFIVLPGQNTTIHLQIGSEKFEMDGITMALVPITGDIREKIVDLIDDRNDIDKAIDSIDESSDIVLNAMEGMTNGLQGVSNGVKEIKQGTQNLHGLNELRDEEIEELKVLLNELLPLMQNVNSDIDTLNNHYDNLVEFDEKMSKDVEELTTNIHKLNNDLDELTAVMKNLPSDVAEINELIKATKNVVSSTSTLVKNLSGSSDDYSESLTKDLTQIATETATIGSIVQQTVPTVTDEGTAGALLKIGSSAGAIGTSLKSVQNTLEEMSNSTLSETSTLQKNLNKLASELDDVDGLINKKDAQKIVNVTMSLRDSSKTLEKMMQTITTYNDKFLQDKDDFKNASDNAKQLVDELSKMNSLSISMIENIQSMLNILSSDFYNGTNKTLDSLVSVNRQLTQITSQSNKIRQSKNDVKKIVDDKMDEIENKTTLFNLDENAKTVSFGSDENEYVESVQFILKTPDIKKVKIVNEDLEDNKETQTFWEKVSLIFQKIWNWITGIFSNN